MSFQNGLFQARKKSGYSQEEVAKKIGVSRQTISKRETGETTPDIFQAKRMSMIYKVTLDELIDYNADLDEIQEDIDKYTDDVVDKIDWSSAWSKRYPILNSYRSTVNVPAYAVRLNAMLDELCRDYRFNEQDAFLVLKDILYRIWKPRKR